MSFLIGLLIAALVINCLLLILLVLIQLPKKEAGAGMAFGGSATDALFGAGSGNALTKITKYAAGVFFALAFAISILHAQVRKSQSTIVLPQNPPAKAPASVPSPTPTPAPAPAVATEAVVNNALPAAAATNTPPAP